MLCIKQSLRVRININFFHLQVAWIKAGQDHEIFYRKIKHVGSLGAYIISRQTQIFYIGQ